MHLRSAFSEGSSHRHSRNLEGNEGRLLVILVIQLIYILKWTLISGRLVAAAWQKSYPASSHGVRSPQMACIFSEVEEDEERIQGISCFLFCSVIVFLSARQRTLDSMSLVLLTASLIPSLWVLLMLSCFSPQSEISAHIAPNPNIHLCMGVSSSLDGFYFGFLLFLFDVFGVCQFVNS